MTPTRDDESARLRQGATSTSIPMGQTVSVQPGAEHNQRELRLRPVYKLNDEELRFLRPRVYDLDDMMEDLGRRQTEAKRYSLLQENYLKKLETDEIPSCGCIMLHPHSNIRVAWEMTGCIMVGYDVVMSPIGLLLDTENAWLTGLSWTVNAFWTIDVLLNFCTGYHKGNRLIMRGDKIAKNYLQTWFLFDILVILPDWIGLGLDSHKDVVDTMSAMRLFKVIRLIRLMRLVKLKRLVSDLLLSRIDSETAVNRLRLALVMGGVLTCLHVIACFWYWVGDTKEGWAGNLNVTSLGIEETYLISLHWALSLIQGTSWDVVNSLTVLERVYMVFTLPVALMLTAILIGCTVEILRRSSEFDAMGQQLALRRVANHYKLPPKLYMRIKNHIEMDSTSFQAQKRERQLIAAVPETLRMDLMMQIYGGPLSRHPFFRFLCARNIQFVRTVCRAVETEDFHAGDQLFGAGDACTSMRFIVNGELSYTHENSVIEANVGKASAQAAEMRVLSSEIKSQRTDTPSPTGFTWFRRGKLMDRSWSFGNAEPERMATKLSRGHWLSEAVLWAVWEHTGKLGAATLGTCALLSYTSFEEAVKLHPAVHWLSVLYARQFVIHLNKMPMSDLIDPPDVKKWKPEAQDCVVQNDASLPWEDQLPRHLEANVVKDCLRLAYDVAWHGLDEHRPHHGFVVIVGDETALAPCGKSGFNPFLGHDLRITDAGAKDTLRRNAFHADGAIVVDGITGRVVASGWFVGDIRLGGSTGGARSRSAKAVAQQAGGCYVIKASEDSRGKLVLHLGTQTQAFNGTLRLD